MSHLVTEWSQEEAGHLLRRVFMHSCCDVRDGPEVFDDTVDVAHEIEVDLGVFSVLTPLPAIGNFGSGRMGASSTSTGPMLAAADTPFEPADMSPAGLDVGVTRAFKRFYEPRRRARRFARQLRRTPPSCSLPIGRNIGRESRTIDRSDAGRTPYRTRPEGLEHLSVTSAAPPSEAIWPAADQVDGGTGRTGTPVVVGR
jgi:hypothetical protein